MSSFTRQSSTEQTSASNFTCFKTSSLIFFHDFQLASESGFLDTERCSLRIEQCSGPHSQCEHIGECQWARQHPFEPFTSKGVAEATYTPLASKLGKMRRSPTTLSTPKLSRSLRKETGRCAILIETVSNSSLTETRMNDECSGSLMKNMLGNFQSAKESDP